HDQQATRYRNEAQQHWQEAAKRPQNDPVRAVEEERARHLQRLADAAATARDHYDGAHRREAAAEQAEPRPQGPDQQAGRHRDNGGDQDRLARALDGMHRGAVKQGTTVERMLADRFHAYEATRAAELSGEASPDLPQPVVDEIRTQLQHVEQVRAKIDEYARNHPETRGVEKWQSRLKDEETPLRRDLRWRGTSA